MEVDVVDLNNKKVRAMELAELDNAKLNKAVLYYAVKAGLNNLRHGTASTKGRSEVCRTNKKVWRQKGTGNARHGPRSANIFVGGGNVFGPAPRSYYERLPKKAKALAYREVLRHLVGAKALCLVDNFEFTKPSTKLAGTFLKSAGLNRALVLVPEKDKFAELSFRNLKNVGVVHENNLNIPDMLRYPTVVMKASFFEELRGRYAL